MATSTALQLVVFPPPVRVAAPPICSVGSGFWGRQEWGIGLRSGGGGGAIKAMASAFKMNLNEYMVTLEKPLGIRKMLKESSGSFSLVLERPFTPFPIHELYNVTRECQVTANGLMEASCLREYVKALERAKDELYYNHSGGMQYSKITEQMYVGSCIQTEADVETLANVMGVAAEINFQSAIEAENWGVNSRLINESCQKNNILMINYPIRAAIACATWDLIAMVEKGSHNGPPTHAVTFVWNGQEGEDIYLVGDFTNDWKDPMKAVHKEDQDMKSMFGFHKEMKTHIQPAVQPSINQPKKDANIIRVIERPLTEDERFMLAKAARCIAFSVCPIKLAPK
ncbi:unnamed protein product [Rhodiola kirilowii]